MCLCWKASAVTNVAAQPHSVSGSTVANPMSRVPGQGVGSIPAKDTGSISPSISSQTISPTTPCSVVSLDVPETDATPPIQVVRNTIREAQMRPTIVAQPVPSSDVFSENRRVKIWFGSEARLPYIYSLAWIRLRLPILYSQIYKNTSAQLLEEGIRLNMSKAAFDFVFTCGLYEKYPNRVGVPYVLDFRGDSCFLSPEDIVSVFKNQGILFPTIELSHHQCVAIFNALDKRVPEELAETVHTIRVALATRYFQSIEMVHQWNQETIRRMLPYTKHLSGTSAVLALGFLESLPLQYALPELQALHFVGSSDDVARAKNIFLRMDPGCFPNLNVLSLSALSCLNVAEVHYLRWFPKLFELKLRNFDSFSRDVIRATNEVPSLTHLDLRDSNLRAHHIATLAELRSIREISLTQAEGIEDAIQKLKKDKPDLRLVVYLPQKPNSPTKFPRQ